MWAVAPSTHPDMFRSYIFILRVGNSIYDPRYEKEAWDAVSTSTAIIAMKTDDSNLEILLTDSITAISNEIFRN